MLEKKIENLNELIINEEIGPNWHGYYPSLAFYYQNTEINPKKKHLAKITNKLTRDIWKISSIFYKIEYIRLHTLKNKNSDSLFGSFITLDIEHFHIILRSLFDNLASMISATASKEKQLSDSFNQLIDRAKNKPNHFIKLTNIELHKTLLDYEDWFISLRTIRDDIAHRNFDSLVFGNQNEDIYFWIKNGNRNDSIKSSYPYYDLIRYNIHDVVSFTKYSGINFALLINLIEEISMNIMQRHNIQYSNLKTGISSAGFEIAKKWAKTVFNKNGV